jgi:hypothetical protein
MKRSYLNGSLTLIDDISEMCPAEVCPMLDELKERVRAMVKKLYDDAVEDHEHIISYYTGWEEWREKRIALTEEEEQNLKSVTPKMLYDFFKEQCVGVLNTWIGKYEGESFMCGPVEVRFMMQPSLSLLRDGRVNDILPMTKGELERIVGENGIGGNEILVQICYNGEAIKDWGEEPLELIAKYLNRIGSDERVLGI